MLTGKRKIRWIAVVLAVVLAFAAAGCSFMNRHPLTRDNIMEQNGFTILSQETGTITLTLPMEEMPLYAQIAARERKNVTWETEGISVYDDGVTHIDLKSIGISGEGGDRYHPAEENILFFKFDITHTLPEEGSIFTVNRVMNTGDSRTYSSRFSVLSESVTDDAAVYEDAVREMGNGPGDLFYVYMDAAVYEKLTGTASFDITLNKTTYQGGSEVREYGDDIRPMDDSAESRYEAAEAQIDFISETYRMPDLS